MSMASNGYKVLLGNNANEWDGIIANKVLAAEEEANRHRLFNAGRNGDWETLQEIVRTHSHLANVTRPGGASLFAPLHHAAFGGGAGAGH